VRKLVSLLAVAALSVGLVLSSVAFGATKKVGVKGLTFSPKTASIKKGGTVKWSWKTGGVPHNVVGKGFKSKTAATVSFSKRFTKKGTYRYVCTIHKAQGMRGTVKVS
jgi:plastocyanin